MTIENSEVKTRRLHKPEPEEDRFIFEDEAETPMNSSTLQSDNGKETMTSSSPESRMPLSPVRKRSVLKTVLTLALLATVGVVGYPMVRDQINIGPTEDPNILTEAVSRGPFRISVTERGTLGSLKNSTLVNKVEGSTTIISIVPEGTVVMPPVVSDVTGTVDEIEETDETHRIVIVREQPAFIVTPFFVFYRQGRLARHYVNLREFTEVLVETGDKVKQQEMLAGDVVCELDSSMLVDQEIQQQILVKQADAKLKTATEAVEIQKTQNESDTAAARLLQELAEIDLRNYTEAESVLAVAEIQSEITISEQNLTQAIENYNFSKRMVNKGYRNLTELETPRIAMEDAQLKVDIGKLKLKVLEEFTYTRDIKEKEENAKETVRQLKRIIRAGRGTLAQFVAELQAAELTYSAESSKLDKLRKQIAGCKLVAPEEGKVVYATQRSRRSEPVIIEEGATVRERQKIIDLPDFSLMKVEAKIHESKISEIHQGQTARIRIDAFPNRIFNGILDVVPDVPVKGEWPNNDIMLYETIVRITDDVSELKPGLTAEVEIEIENRDDVLQTPMQSIVSVGDKYVAYVMSKDGRVRRREDVKIGKSNEKTIEVLSGLEEGERVVMNPRGQFAKELAELEAKFAAKDAEGPASSKKADGKHEKKAGDSYENEKKTGGKKKGGPKSKNQGRPGGQDVMAFFKAMDKNGDGKIAREEAPQRMQENFGKMDANGDDAIDSDEWKKSRAARPRGGGGPPT